MEAHIVAIKNAESYSCQVGTLVEPIWVIFLVEIRLVTWNSVGAFSFFLPFQFRDGGPATLDVQQTDMVAIPWPFQLFECPS